jgi:DHA2 family multidrug resistance protein-like MFS transporter
MTTEHRTATAGRREWIALAVLALPCIVYAMDLTVLYLAVPSLSADLHPTGTQLLWIVDIYGFVTAGLLITMGTIGDRIGRRRLLLIGSALFAAASVLAAVSASVVMLIVARALLGAAGATLAPSTLSLVRALFADRRERTVAVGVWISSFSFGAAVGPLVGGAVLSHFSWGAVFVPSIPVMVLRLVVGPRLLPEYRSPDAGRPDLLSVALSIAAVLLFVFGFKHIARDGWDATGLVALVAALALGFIFVGRQRRLADPLLDLRLFRGRGFNVVLVANTIAFFVNFGSLLFLAQYLQAVLGLSSLAAGLWSMPAAFAFIAGSTLTPRVVRRARPASLVAGGLLTAALGFLLLTQVGPETGLPYLVGGWVVFAAGLSAVTTLAVDLIVSSAPPERAGAASGVAETSAELGGAMGIAVLGAVAAAVYRHQLPASVQAGDTIGEAARSGGEVAGAARDAFIQGMHVAAGLSALLVTLAAVAVLSMLRRERVQSPAVDQPAAVGAQS